MEVLPVNSAYRLFMLLIVACCYYSSAKAAFNGNYTINQSAAASSTNYKTFSDLASDLAFGTRKDASLTNGPGISGKVTINVVKGSGPYYEQVVFDSIAGVNNINTILLNGNGEKISANTGSSLLFVIRVNGADYLSINNLQIEATGISFARCVEIRNESNNITIGNCLLSTPYLTGTSSNNAYIAITNGTSSPAVYTNPGTSITLSGNTMKADINKGPYYGIWLSNTANGTTGTGYKILNNDIADVYNTFIAAYYTVNTIIEANKLHNTGHSRTGYLYGIYMYNYLTRCDAVIARNQLYHFNDSSSGAYDGRYPLYVYMYGSPNNGALEISNNVFDIRCRYYTPGVYVYGYAASNNAVKFLYNTLYFGGAVVNTYNFGLYLSQLYYVNAECRNNIFFCDWNIGGPLYAFYYTPGSLQFEGNVYDHDKISGSGTFYAGYNGNNYATLNDWNTAVNGKNNLKTSFLPVDADKQNWQPTSFYAMNKGIPVSVQSDLNYKSRHAITPDAGAYEYTQDVAVGPVVLTDSVICSDESMPVKIWVKNNSAALVRNIPLVYAINQQIYYRQSFNLLLNSGDSVLLTFSQPATFHQGTQTNLNVMLDAQDDDSTNNAAKANIKVLLSPWGGFFTKASLFDGYFKTGTSTDPDIAVASRKIGYDIQNPAGFTNADYNKTWTMQTIAYTSGGIKIDSGIVYQAPSGSNSGNLKFTPSSNQNDSLVFIGVKAINLSNGCDSVFGRWVYIPPSPVVLFNATSVCEGEVVEFKNQTTIAKGELIYFWDFGDPVIQSDTSDAIQPVYKYANFGYYVPRLTVQLKKYPYFSFDYAAPIQISQVPLTDFSAANACSGLAVTFNNKTSLSLGNLSEIKYQWDFGDGSGVSTLTNPFHLYQNPGVYKVKLIAEYKGCKASVTKNANQFAVPEAAFSADTGCNLSAIKFYNNSTISIGSSGYQWYFDDGSFSNLADPSHYFLQAGKHLIKLVATSEFGCIDSVLQEIELKESPVADFTYSEPCNRELVQFTNSTQKADNLTHTWLWNFSDEGSSLAESPYYLFRSLGFKQVTLTATASNGCKNSISRSFIVKRQAKAQFDANDVCEGEQVQFTNKSTIDYGNLQFEWRFGDGSRSFITSPKKEYNINGNSKTFLVTLVAVVPDGCSDSVTRPVTVNAKANAKFTYNVSGRFVQFTPATVDNSFIYNWRFGEGSRSNETSPLHQYSNIDNGTFTACLGIINTAECLSEWCEDISIDLVNTQKVEEQAVLVYPNPAREKITIKLKDNITEIVYIHIFDMAGRALTYPAPNLDNTSITLDINDLAEGCYFIRVVGKKQSYLSHFVKH